MFRRERSSANLLAKAQLKLRDIENKIIALETEIKSIPESKGKVSEINYETISILNDKIDHAESFDAGEKRALKLMLIKKADKLSEEKKRKILIGIIREHL